jgi:hypothetical protein
LVLSPELRDAIDKDQDSIDIQSERVDRPTSFTAPEPEQLTAGGIENPTPEAPAKRKYTRQSKPPEMPPAQPPQESSQANPEAPPSDDVPFDPHNDLPTAQQEISSFLTDGGHSWDDLVAWNGYQQFITSVDLATLGGFDDLPTSDAMWLLGSKKGLLTAISNFKKERASR